MSNTKKGAGAAPNGKATATPQSTTKTARLNPAEALAEKIQAINAKKELVNNRLLLQDTLDKVQEIKVDDPESLKPFDQHSGLRVVFYEGYNNEVLKISSRAFIEDFRQFFIERCEERIQELDKQILV
jgi:hypothetical protein